MAIGRELDHSCGLHVVEATTECTPPPVAPSSSLRSTMVSHAIPDSDAGRLAKARCCSHCAVLEHRRISAVQFCSGFNQRIVQWACSVGGLGSGDHSCVEYPQGSESERQSAPEEKVPQPLSVHCATLHQGSKRELRKGHHGEPGHKAVRQPQCRPERDLMCRN